VFLSRGSREGFKGGVEEREEFSCSGDEGKFGGFAV
jgi:hypothetical protein